MNNIFKEVYLNVSINKNNLTKNEQAYLNVDLINKSNYILENTLIKIDLNTNIFSVIDEKYIDCINDFGNIGNIEKNSINNFSFPIKVENTCLNMPTSVFANINFHIIKNNKINDFNVLSNELEINFNEENFFEAETSSKLIDINYEVFENEDFEEIINHKIKIKNKSKAELENIVLRQNREIYFVKDSVKVNLIPRINENLNYFLLGELDPNEEILVEFKTKPQKDIYDLSFLVDFELYNSKITEKSNSLDIKVVGNNFNENSFTKKLKKIPTDEKNIFEFNIEFINVGNNISKDVYIKDFLPSEFLFIKNSLIINQKKVDFDIFEDGIYFEKIMPLQKINISYKVKMIQQQKIQITPAILLYNKKTLKSKVINLYKNLVDINVKKELSSYNAHIGDIISAKLFIQNKGDVDLESLKIIDNVNASLEFIKGSLKVNSKILKNIETLNGLSIKSLNKGENLSITYQLKVIDLPKPNPVIDKTTINYCYIDNNLIKNDSVVTTKNKIFVNNPNLYVEDKNSFFENQVSTKICKNNDFSNFNIFVENRGNVVLEEVYLKFNFPKELEINEEFLEKSTYKYDKKNKDIYIGNLNISECIFIDFLGKVKLVEDEEFDFTIYFEYKFKDLKNEGEYKEVKKFTQKIKVIEPKITVQKTLNKSLFENEDELIKNIIIKNDGNVDFYNLTVDLNEPEFLKNIDYTFLFNGKYINKNNNLFLDKLKVGEKVNLSLKYNCENIKVLEDTIYETIVKANYDLYNMKKLKITAKSNKLDFKVINPNLSAVQKFSSNIFMLNEKYTYILNLNNNGNCDLFDVLININLPKNLKYIKNSIYINNKNTDFNDLKDVKIKKIMVGESLNICFDFLVEKTSNSEFVLINTDIEANYKNLDKIITKSFKTAKQQIKIESANLQIAKFVSHEYLQKGDILTVQNILNNTGSINLKNVTLTDNINNNLDFVCGSVFIDGENFEFLNPLEGIVIDLKSSKNILIKYDYEYSPKLYYSRINHYSTVNYSYEIKDEKIKTNSIKSEVIKIEAGLSTFKQFNVENKYTLSEFEPDIYEIVGVFTDGFIESVYDAKKSSSDENSKKVIIKGSLIDRVEYLTKKDKASLYLFERTNPFSIFINIPSDCYSEDINFKVKCDDVFYRINNKRSIFMSSLISIEGVL